MIAAVLVADAVWRKFRALYLVGCMTIAFLLLLLVVRLRKHSQPTAEDNMEIKKAFKTDPKKEVEGVIIPMDDTSWIRVARMNNPKFLEYMQEAMKPHKQAVRLQTLPEAVAERVYIEGVAHTILLEWGGFTDEGEELKPTVENRIAMLSSKDHHDFLELVEKVAGEAQNYREVQLKQGAENVKTGSAGTSGGEVS